MDRDYIERGIKSRKARMEYEKERARQAIESDDFTIAALAIANAAIHLGAISELEVMREYMEV